MPDPQPTPPTTQPTPTPPAAAGPPWWFPYVAAALGALWDAFWAGAVTGASAAAALIGDGAALNTRVLALAFAFGFLLGAGNYVRARRSTTTGA